VALQAQSLERVEALASEGRAFEAREELAGWWEEEAPGASRSELQRGIWHRARLTEDADAAVREYLGLVVEYPGGAYSDRALSRVAQDAEMRRDWARAAHLWETLVRNYPQSPLREGASAWLERHRAEAEGARSGSASPDARAVPTDSSVADPPSPASPPLPPQGDYAIQLGAFSSLGAARALERRVREAGLDPRLVKVPGTDLVRVRVGRFVAAADADSLRARVRSLGLEAMVVSDASNESAVP
jgi:hypothetical protein